MLWTDLVLRWLHILNAAILAGGLIFWRFSFLPAKDAQTSAPADDLTVGVRKRWAKLVMISSGLLLVTGLVNFMLGVQRFEFDKSTFPGSKYHMLFGIKFLLSLAVFTLAALLSGRTAAAENLRRRERTWLNVTVLLVIAVVCLGGLLRAAVRHPKSVQSSLPSESTSQAVMNLEQLL